MPRMSTTIRFAVYSEDSDAPADITATAVLAVGEACEITSHSVVRVSPYFLSGRIRFIAPDEATADQAVRDIKSDIQHQWSADSWKVTTARR